MTKASKVVTSFNFRGELDKVSYKKKKIKYVKLVTEQDAQWIKIPKKLRPKVANLSLGCRLEVEGRTKQNLTTGKVKHKARMIVVLAQDNADAPEIKVKTVSYYQSSTRKANPKLKY